MTDILGRLQPFGLKNSPLQHNSTPVLCDGFWTASKIYLYSAEKWLLETQPDLSRSDG
jgi:hypothetical protein